MPEKQGRPSSATVIACIALFFALSGSAIALQGRNSVDSGDIKPKAVKTSDIANNAVTTKKIKNNHVRAADIQNNAVGTGEIRNGQVRAGDLAAQEAFHLVGQAGEPPFLNGVEGDCLHANSTAMEIRFNPAGFYKDALGRVHLMGIVTQSNGPGGDAVCEGAGAGESIEDRLAFVLPEGYRPTNDEVRQVDTLGLLIVGTTPIVTPGGTVPAGGVFVLTGSGAILEDVSFRAAGPSTGLPRRDTSSSRGLPDSILDLLG
jgi:hypothetical protein